tara:strand:- start:39 stop:236 length:198 start_codon:yes stop_codon:yes gene_type:complete
MKDQEPLPPALLWLVIALTLVALAPLSIIGIVYPDKWTLLHTVIAGLTSPYMVAMVVILYVAYRK